MSERQRGLIAEWVTRTVMRGAPTVLASRAPTGGVREITHVLDGDTYRRVE